MQKAGRILLTRILFVYTSSAPQFSKTATRIEQIEVHSIGLGVFPNIMELELDPAFTEVLRES